VEGGDQRNSKAVIEAALFAAGKTLTKRELSAISGLTQDEAGDLAEELSGEYAQRKSGIEIRILEDRYVMQVRPGLASSVISVAPKEIEAPLLRTLAIIAYKQPLKQSALAEIRGNKSYDHVKKLEEMGLISSVKAGRTKLLTTTRNFADYFGLDSVDPKSIRHALLSRQKCIGITKMYESLAVRMGLDYILVNPYKPQEEDLDRLEEIDLLIVAPGYAGRIKEIYSGEIMEAGVRTISQLKESIEAIARQSGQKLIIEPLMSEIDGLLTSYRERAKGARAVRPMTPMIEDLARDLRIPIEEDGISTAPTSAGLEAKLYIPAHQPYDLDIVERIKQRCEALIQGLKQ
jgi:segregation and condensation protein B